MPKRLFLRTFLQNFWCCNLHPLYDNLECYYALEWNISELKLLQINQVYLLLKNILQKLTNIAAIYNEY